MYPSYSGAIDRGFNPFRNGIAAYQSVTFSLSMCSFVTLSLASALTSPHAHVSSRPSSNAPPFLTALSQAFDNPPSLSSTVVRAGGLTLAASACVCAPYDVPHMPTWPSLYGKLARYAMVSNASSGPWASYFTNVPSDL